MRMSGFGWVKAVKAICFWGRLEFVFHRPRGTGFPEANLKREVAKMERCKMTTRVSLRISKLLSVAYR